MDSGNDEGKNSSIDIDQLSPDCNINNCERNAKSTMNGTLKSGFDATAVTEISNQFKNSKRKRKLKDFSDYETDYGIKSKNKRQIAGNDVDVDNSVQSVIENKATTTSSNDFKYNRSKHLDKLRNTRSKRQKSVVLSSSKKDVQNQQIGETENKQDAVDKLEGDANIKSGIEDLEAGLCGDSRDINEKQKGSNKRKKLTTENDKKKTKISHSPSKIKVLYARVVPRLESSDADNINLDKHESNNTSKTDMFAMDVDSEGMKSSSASSLSKGEKSCPSDVNGPHGLNTTTVPLSEATNVIKKYSSTKIEIEPASNIAKIDNQEPKRKNWFNFSNLKQVIFQCIYENCTFSSKTHSDWLYHFRISHQEEKNRPIMARCLKCQYEPSEKRILKEHLLVKHNDSLTAPVGYKFCRIVHENSTHEMKILACIFCGFVMDEANFSSEHRCERLTFYFYCPWCDTKEMHFEKINRHIQSSHCNEIIHGKEVSNKHSTLRTSEKDPASGIDEHETTCKDCQAEFRENEELKLHVNNEHAIYPYGCGVCRLCYGRLCGIRDHMKKVHLLSYKCCHCNRGFGSRTDLKRHESTHSVIRPLKCDFCDNRYSDKNALHTHIGIKHPKEWISWKYPDSSEKSDSFMCHLCGEHLDTSVQFSKHQQTKHLHKDCEKSKSLNCKICLQVFTTRRKYNFHNCVQKSNVLKQAKEILKRSEIKTLSGSGKRVKCNLCNKQFNNRKSLQEHLFGMHLNDDEKRYACSECERGFWKKSELRAHLRIHRNSKPYRCKVCSKRFRQLGHVKEHLLSHARRGKFSCPLCLQEFKTKSTLRSHVFGHCKMFPFECPVVACTSKYSTVSRLNSHFRECAERTEEDFICKICDKDLPDIKSAVTHMKLHEIDEVYLCVICDEKFTSPIYLCQHKIKSDHFSEDERECASSCQKSTQTFKCVEIDSDVSVEKLVHQYEYVNQQDLEAVVNESAVEECIIEQNDFSNITDQLTTVKQENCELNPIVEQDEHDIDAVNNQLHINLHEKDDVYICVICDERFSSPMYLCQHKIKSDHFSEDERECASSCQKSTQTFKCVEIDSDVSVEKLVHQYEYVNQQDLEAVVNESAVEECIIEQNDFSNMTDQLTTVKQENCEINPIPENNEHNNDVINNQVQIFADNVELSEADEQRKVTSFIVDGNNYVFENQEVGDILHQSNKLPVIEMQGNTCILPNEYTDTCDNTLVDLTSQKNSESENSVVGTKSDGNCETGKNNNEDNIPESCLPPDSINDENQVYRDVHEDKNHLQTDLTVIGENIKVVDENVLAVLKLLSKNGDEGYPIHIQGNQDVIQTILSTGRYSIQCTTNTELDQESVVNDHILQVAEEQVGTMNEELVHEVIESSQISEIVGKFPCKEEVMLNVVKNSHNVSLKANRNIDKIEGILMDKEAESNNKKMQNGNLDYKVRLCYYEDRSKNADKYPLKCELCDKRYKRVKDLNLHKKVHLSNDERPFKCEKCGKGFTTRHAYRTHQRIHTGDRPYSCNQCDKTFRQMGHLQTHLRAHADYRPFQCTHCNKTFLTNSLLKGHVKQNHSKSGISNDPNISELENSNCGICGDTFVSLLELRIHQIKHLSKKDEFDLLKDFSDMKNTDKDLKGCSESSMRPGQTKSSNKSQMCDICGKIVTCLNRHKMLHKTDSKVTCHVCGKEFPASVLLKSHMQQYHSESSFQCETCGKILKNRYCLYSHTKLHKRQSFTCLNCEKKYVSKKLFLSHLVSCIGDSFVQKLDSCLVSL